MTDILNVTVPSGDPLGEHWTDPGLGSASNRIERLSRTQSEQTSEENAMSGIDSARSSDHPNVSVPGRMPDSRPEAPPIRPHLPLPSGPRTQVPAHLAKRATYDPRMIAPLRTNSGAEPATTSEFTIHPSISAYQRAHPRRPLINFGPYILLQTLGEGEFGKVKLGVHKDYGEEVAVKLIRRGSVDNDTRLTKVEREIDVLKVRALNLSIVMVMLKCCAQPKGCKTP